MVPAVARALARSGCKMDDRCYYVDDVARKAYTYYKDNMPANLSGKREVSFEEQAWAVQIKGYGLSIYGR
jgi:hypothetical protein